MEDKNIEITQREYNDLLHASRILDALLSSGVDNWIGYEYAMESINEEHYE